MSKGKLVTARPVRAFFGDISAMTLWRWVQFIPDFPRPIKIRGRNYWKLDDLIAWRDRRYGADVDDSNCAEDITPGIVSRSSRTGEG